MSLHSNIDNIVRLIGDLKKQNFEPLRNNLELAETQETFVNLSNEAGYKFNTSDLELFSFWARDKKMDINEISQAKSLFMKCPTGTELHQFCQKKPNHVCCSSTRFSLASSFGNLDKILSLKKGVDQQADMTDYWFEDRKIITDLWK